MTTGNCKYEDGKVDSCFDCGCPECVQSVKAYEEWINERAMTEEYNSIVTAQGACNE